MASEGHGSARRAGRTFVTGYFHGLNPDICNPGKPHLPILKRWAGRSRIQALEPIGCTRPKDSWLGASERGQNHASGLRPLLFMPLFLVALGA